MQKHNLSVPEDLLEKTDFVQQLFQFLRQYEINLPTENVPQFQLNSIIPVLAQQTQIKPDTAKKLSEAVEKKAEAPARKVKPVVEESDSDEPKPTEKKAEPPVGGLFANKPQASVGGLFANMTAVPAGGLFANKPQASAGGLFAQKPQASAGGLFANKPVKESSSSSDSEEEEEKKVEAREEKPKEEAAKEEKPQEEDGEYQKVEEVAQSPGLSADGVSIISASQNTSSAETLNTPLPQ